MSTFQEVIIIGNLGSDLQTKVFENGQVTNISVATTESWIDKVSGEKKESTEWHFIALHGKLSELADKYLYKGSKVLIKGKLKTRKYLDSANVERYVTEIQGREMKFMSPPREQQPAPQSAVDQYQAKHQNAQTPSPGKEEDDPDLPF